MECTGWAFDGLADTRIESPEPDRLMVWGLAYYLGCPYQPGVAPFEFALEPGLFHLRVGWQASDGSLFHEWIDTRPWNSMGRAYNEWPEHPTQWWFARSGWFDRSRTDDR